MSEYTLNQTEAVEGAIHAVEAAVVCLKDARTVTLPGIEKRQELFEKATDLMREVRKFVRTLEHR